jgi:hypothetical protein
MLELGQVVKAIADMGMEARRREERVSDQMTVALQQASMNAEEWTAARERIDALPESPWQCAQAGAQPPATTRSLPFAAPPEYSALATDGSHIPLDRHAIAPCYLLNVGEIALHYGSGERPHMVSRATLHYKEEEIYSGTASGDPVPLSERMVTNKRLLAESAALAALIAQFHERTAVALVDDPLIVWTPAGESDDAQKKVIVEFCLMLDAGMQARMPVAGYVSRPGHRDVVGLLRKTLCPDGCTHLAGSPCRRIVHLTDAHLFARLLSPGDRSQVFGSSAPNQKHYPDDHKIGFFYVNTGAEIARVEVPRWVAADGDLLDRAHVLVHDQAAKGQGYPVALSEAHERAIVRGPERNAFFSLVEQSFIRQNLPIRTTRKAMSKRTPLV